MLVASKTAQIDRAQIDGKETLSMSCTPGMLLIDLPCRTDWLRRTPICHSFPKRFSGPGLAMDWPKQSDLYINGETANASINQATRFDVLGGERLRDPRHTLTLPRHRQQRGRQLGCEPLLQ